jgi:hypothetical protein
MIKVLMNIPKPLTISATISVIIYCCLKFWLNKIPEFFEVASDISELIAQICLAIITGYIFYAIVNQLKEDEGKKNIEDFIETRIGNIYNSYNSVYTEMNESTNFYTSIPPTENELKELLVKIETTLNLPKHRFGPPINRNMTWLEFLIYEQQKTKKEINRLLNISSLIDTSLIKICCKIEDSNYFFWLEQMKGFDVDYKQFSAFSSSFHEYSLLTISLQKYAYENGFIKESEETLKIIKRIIDKGIPKNEVEHLSKK